MPPNNEDGKPRGGGTLGRSFFGAVGQPAALAATSAAGLVGTGTDVRIAAVVATGGLLTAAVPDAVSAVLERVRSWRAGSVPEVLAQAAAEANCTLDDFLQKIDGNPLFRRVVAETVQGAADATYDEKLDALSANLGRAYMTDDVREEQRTLERARIIRDLEESHALVLWTVNTDPPIAGTDEGGSWNGWTFSTLAELQLGALLTPTVEFLRSNGLIHDMVQADGARSRFELSAWGEDVLGLLTSKSASPS